MNWGLGHASRCIPIIQALKDLGHEIIIASDGAALQLLQANFPVENFLELPLLKIRYASKSGAVWSVLSQLPKLNQHIRREKKHLDQFLQTNAIDLIISDNRYGIYHGSVPSVILTHQLRVKIPLASGVTAGLIRSRLKYFDECWIPDDQRRSCSGELTATNLAIEKVSIGILSQFLFTRPINELSESNELLAILSGPEPDRSRFEKLLVEQSQQYKLPILIVRGTEESKQDLPYVRFRSFLNAEQLLQEFRTHDRIISRSGYSSIMDLVSLGKKALLVPSPGQPEQEYLANYHRDRGNFYSVNQKNLDLKKDVRKAFGDQYATPEKNNTMAQLKQILSERIELLTQ